MGARRAKSSRRGRHGLRVGGLVVVLGLLGTACTGDSGDKEAFCTEIAEVAPLSTLIAGFSEADPVELDNRLETAADAYAKLRDDAPEEIRGDVDQVVDLSEAVIEAVRANRQDPEAVVDQVREAVADRPDVPAATKALSDYAAKECKVDLNPTVDAPGVTPTTSG